MVRNLRDRPQPVATGLHGVVPVPAAVTPAEGVEFTLDPAAVVQTEPRAADVGAYLADMLRPATGWELPVRTAMAGAPVPSGGIGLSLSGADEAVGEAGYDLTVGADSVLLRARTPTGLFHGVQTLRQLLPPAVESRTRQAGPWKLPGGRVVDHPRFSYRGAMLDVARHFFGVDDVLRYLDHLVLYKINYLHLHLSDDQGWRIAIDSWPRLASHGGSTQVGGGAGGYYTKEQYRTIVEYARRRFVTVVPEIELPGHTNAALAAYPQLACDGKDRELYTGIAVGFSAVCPAKAVTYDFVDDVLGEVAALTPGPYLHIGGDEVETLSTADYAAFIERVQAIVAGKGKTTMAWHQAAVAGHCTGRVLQYWAPGADNGGGAHDGAEAVADAVARGAGLVLSPADRTYLDMKYTSSTRLGQSWAGLVDVRTAYDWDPGALLAGVDPAAVLGIEAPLWTETLGSLNDLEFMAFPRLAAIAELGWSPRSTHDWGAFQERLAAQRARWAVMGIDFYDAPD